jgi:hypothetical protein
MEEAYSSAPLRGNCAALICASAAHIQNRENHQSQRIYDKKHNEKTRPGASGG